MITLIRDATILTLDASDAIHRRGHVLVRDGIITAVGDGDYAGAERPDTTIDGTNRLVAPGLINAHTHSQSSTMAGFGDRLSHPAFMWLTQAHTSRRTADEIRLAVLLTAWGMMASGSTAAIDHFPGQRFTAADMDAVLAAWEETGLRAALGMRFFDGAFADIFPEAPLPEDLKARIAQVEILKPQGVDELRDLMGDTIAHWHGRAGRLSVFPAPSNPDRCTDAALLLCAELAEKHDTGIHTHLLETRKQARLAADKYGETAVRHLETLGVLSPRWSCAHAIWLDDADIELMAQRGVVAVLNPESNARLGTGLARAPEMLRAGVTLALGTDGASANDNMVLHEAMRAVATSHRAAEPDRSRWITARDVLRMATAGGAAALRRPGLGAIAPGAPADLVLYRLDTPWWTPLNDPVAQLVFAETGAAVDTVMVDGRIVLDHGRVTTFDTDALVREVRDMAASLRVRNADLFGVATAIAEIVP
ncbi:amidohydrolase family protein [Rhodoplanes sp. TEM]|uniref:Amidohydrolase family protein n=1 Tax=Rhodoplanes tepidamans TaxID=200616 RepID=A0ABT5J9K5_RHOTP|nr:MULTISPECIES: amidohydrolase family protein [Rhodoplanes]MDC7786324.1 amidohydrolase family protein [Rhodoplanes tepidamans]MDC7984717.1 amidohydrolase family protein [Rhodoplanes sp. TEM]MDQ0354067.1 cytosine/adenosine deaminase-related metal-dependent hydrolase [Rhodoplanes tepidamans]